MNKLLKPGRKAGFFYGQTERRVAALERRELYTPVHTDVIPSRYPIVSALKQGS